jgi:uncharacterized repeat protein (TIGR03847 family)
MGRQVHLFDPPARFVVGTVGQPGERTFFLQASGGGRTVSVALEKAQVAVLADRLGALIDNIRRTTGLATTPVEDTAPLDTPVEEEFRVGSMGLAWDPDDERIVVEALGQGGDPESEPLSDSEQGPDALRVRLDLSAALAFVTRAMRVIAAGRPPCPLCGLPLDPAGHVCPRQNGHRR